MTNQGKQTEKLHRTMKSRHLFMIALGGVLGTGFFNSTGFTIANAGPIGTILSYLVGGLVMYFVMLCLGELAVARPVAGSFQDYSTKYIGPATGFTVGWMYWGGWAITVALELVTIGLQMQRWFPDTPIWVWSLIFGVLLFVVNSVSVRSFAEIEFWFSSIKLSAIILFIVIGSAAMFGWIPMSSGESAPMFHNLTADGWFPTGIKSVLVTMLAVNFSFQGTELIGIAAGESDNPEKTIPRSIRQTVWRTILFFGLAIVVLVSLLPYQEAGVTESPFVAALDKIGVPYAADIMNFVIITALLSVANSGLYATTRMLYSLAENKMAPTILQKVSKRGVPFPALVVSMAFASLSLLTYKFAQETVYVWLLSVAGMTAVLAWMSIALSQYFFRKKYLAEGGKVEDLKYRTPLYPFLPLFTFGINGVILLSLALDPETAPSLTIGIPLTIGCYLLYYFLYGRKEKNKG